MNLMIPMNLMEITDMEATIMEAKDMEIADMGTMDIIIMVADMEVVTDITVLMARDLLTSHNHNLPRDHQHHS